jgi:hypothetical protein
MVGEILIAIIEIGDNRLKYRYRYRHRYRHRYR